MALDPITGILNIVDDVIGGVTSAKKAELELKLKALDIAAQEDTDQTAVNTAEASSASTFVAGARPFIMWGLGSVVVLYGLLITFINFSIALGYHTIPMPPLDPMIRDIVLGLLGLGHLTRTFEKWKGIQGNH